MLEVMRDYFSLTPEHMFHQIQGMRHSAEEVLKNKGINYDLLKPALVPSQTRREIALVFDTMSIDVSWYGLEVMSHVIPLFERESTFSVLVGDYLTQPGQEEQLFYAFEKAVVPRRDITFRHPTQFFVVYINHLTDAMVKRFDEGLREYHAYVGLADMTYTSAFKIYLSTMLINSFLKHRNIVIQGHEPDRDPDEDVNMCGYPFEENGYLCRSISDDLMGVLLSYKIERPVFPGFEVDTEFALNAVSVTPMPLEDFEIEVAAAKLKYLKTHKAGSIKRAGLQAITIAQLAALVQEKISASYIYNLRLDQTHNTTKFNIIVELPPERSRPATRLLAALEYEPDRKTLRLITLF
jgi:hypothetical protein